MLQIIIQEMNRISGVAGVQWYNYTDNRVSKVDLECFNRLCVCQIDSAPGLFHTRVLLIVLL